MPSREGHSDALGRHRSWCLIQLVGQMETPQLEADQVYQDEALTMRHVAPAMLPMAGEEVRNSGGCLPTWVFRSRLRVFLTPPAPGAAEARGCLGCRALHRDYANHLSAANVLWECRIDQRQGNSVELPNNREFPIYEHHPDICTFGYFPAIRRAYFFGPRTVPTTRGTWGWRILLDAHLSLVLPSLFHERSWSVKLCIDGIFPLDKQLHSWLGGFVRMHGLLRV